MTEYGFLDPAVVDALRTADLSVAEPAPEATPFVLVSPVDWLDEPPTREETRP